MTVAAGSDLLAARAEEFAERPAVIMATSGTVITYGEMRRRSNQLARFFRSVGLRPRRRRRHPDGESSWIPGSGLGGSALRPVLRRHQLASQPLRGRVHPGRLRGAGARHVVGSARPRGTSSGNGCPVSRSFFAVTASSISRHTAGTRSSSSAPTDLSDPTEGCELLYSSGTTGRPKAVKRPLPGPGELVANHEGAARQLPDYLRDQRGLPLPVARAAVPLCTAHELYDDPSHRRHRDRDGALRRRGDASP